eukprot:g11925.t1
MRENFLAVESETRNKLFWALLRYHNPLFHELQLCVNEEEVAELLAEGFAKADAEFFEDADLWESQFQHDLLEVPPDSFPAVVLKTPDLFFHYWTELCVGHRAAVVAPGLQESGCGFRTCENFGVTVLQAHPENAVGYLLTSSEDGGAQEWNRFWGLFAFGDPSSRSFAHTGQKIGLQLIDCRTAKEMARNDLEFWGENGGDRGFKFLPPQCRVVGSLEIGQSTELEDLRALAATLESHRGKFLLLFGGSQANVIINLSRELGFPYVLSVQGDFLELCKHLLKKSGMRINEEGSLLVAPEKFMGLGTLQVPSGEGKALQVKDKLSKWFSSAATNLDSALLKMDARVQTAATQLEQSATIAFEKGKQKVDEVYKKKFQQGLLQEYEGEQNYEAAKEAAAAKLLKTQKIAGEWFSSLKGNLKKATAELSSSTETPNHGPHEEARRRSGDVESAEHGDATTDMFSGLSGAAQGLFESLQAKAAVRAKKNLQESTKDFKQVAQGILSSDALAFHEKRQRTIFLTLNYLLVLSEVEVEVVQKSGEQNQNQKFFTVHSCRRINQIRRLSFEEERPKRLQLEYKDKAVINIYEMKQADKFMKTLQSQLMALNIGMKNV